MRVGIIGAGVQGTRRAYSLTRGDGSDTLVIVADVNIAAASLLARKAGCEATARWEDVVERGDVEAVLVCTPPHVHYLVSVAAMAGGHHVLCEKPLAGTVAEAEEMVRVAQERKVVLKCGLSFRHHPGIQQARRWLAEGRLGKLAIIRGLYGHGGRPDYAKEWRTKAEVSGGGALMDLGIHLLDLCAWFLPDLREGFASFSTSVWEDAPVEDNAFVLLRSPGGQVASIHASWTHWKPRFAWELFGHQGYALVEGLGRVYGPMRATWGQPTWSGPFPEETIEFYGEDSIWQAEWQEFVAAIREGREPIGSGRDGLRALRLAQALYEAADRSGPITLPADLT